MKKFVNILGKILLWFFATVGALAVAVLIYYYPVIDRLFIRPCYYYPNAFIDCAVKEEPDGTHTN